MSTTFGPRRAQWLRDLTGAPLTPEELQAYERLDGIYRALCAMLYNYAPMSGHPGGSISSGRFVSMLLFHSMDYDFGRPDREDADVISYAAGHKALGLYAMWALRNEIVRLAAPALMPQSARDQLRLEDLLGFRRNPQTATPLFKQHGARALDGHPTPATPFIKLSTGASGVGLGSSLGLAVAMADWFGPGAPRLHVVEGEGGLTPGRVSEALAFAGTASLRNAVVHVDWNQASIDSERVTREGGVPGDYVQWDPAELFYLHDWNVISVDHGMDFQAIAAAQKKALSLDNGQPTAIVYRTVKGWKYGIEGRASHGAGHKLCSPGFYASLPLPESARATFPKCSPDDQRCAKGSDALEVERCFYDGLLAIRRWVEDESLMTAALAARLVKSRERLDAAQRQPRVHAPRLADAFALTAPGTTPPELALAVGTEVTLRGQLGKALGTLNTHSGGAVLLSAADLLGSTSLGDAAKGFEAGFFNAQGRAGSRVLSVGGICEDASAAVLSGIAAFGHHLGAAASYGAFLAPLGHIAARLHAIGSQARHERLGTPTTPMILVCAHAGLKTGEDGPTHADPQPLQLFQENFPPGAMVTLTPWDPAEIWPLLSTALAARPAVIAPFVTRPSEVVLDRVALGLAPASEAAQGVYRLRRARGKADVTVVLQESGVAYAFLTEALPLLERAGLDVEAYYVASAELFDRLPAEERERIFPEATAMQAMGITGFTLATMYRWIRSDAGRAATLHPYAKGQYPGSGSGRAVIAEAGLDGASQFERIAAYVKAKVKA